MAHDASFGYWVRRRRRALDLTQEELARQAGCAADTIKKIEADARRPSRQLAQRLADVLALAPDEQPRFLQTARAQQRVATLPDPLVPTLAAQSTALPFIPTPPTPLIGRQNDVAAVGGLFADGARLVTLVGPGGVGKTRLALQVAAELRSVQRDGAAFVALASLRDEARVVATIGGALQLQPRDDSAQALGEALARRHLLLVLDNLEQLLGAAPQLVTILAAAPELRLLVTSRAVLHVSGEHAYTVRPLTLPDPTLLPPLGALAQVPAVALFAARARAVQGTWALTATNAPVVAAICVRLDGLPLAIELVAAQSRVFTPSALLARLDAAPQRSGLALLSGGPRDLPPRHQTLRTTLDWSYELLSAREQALFRRIGVFVNGATLPAITVVCQPLPPVERLVTGQALGVEANNEHALLATLTALVDNSLLQVREGDDGEPRFAMLELVREYALEQLVGSGELEQTRRRHMAFFLEQARGTAFAQANQGAWLQRLITDHANVRAAMQWSQRARHTSVTTGGNEQITYAGYLPGILSEVDRSLLTRFSDETGIAVRMLPAPHRNNSLVNYHTYRDLCQDPSSNIDVLLLDVVWVGGLAPFLADLGPQLGAQAAQYYQAIIANNTVDGRLVAMPWNFDIGMLYVRTDLLQKYGLGAPPKSWDELEQQARIVAAGERRQNPHFHGLVFQGTAFEGLTCSALEWLASSGGGRIVEKGLVTLDNAQAVAMLNRVRGWIGDIVPSEVTSYGEEDALAVFQAGNAAFLRGWPVYYSTTRLNDTASAERFAVTPLPAADGYGHVGSFGGFQLGVVSTSPRREAAIAFVRYMTSPEVQLYRAVVGDAVPALPQVVNRLATTRLLPFLKELDRVEWVARPSRLARARYPAFSTCFYEGIQRILRGANAALVVPQLAQQLQQVLNEPSD